jgi:hypothetical protein
MTRLVMNASRVYYLKEQIFVLLPAQVSRSATGDTSNKDGFVRDRADACTR